MIIRNIKYLTYLYFLEGFLLLLFIPPIVSAFFYKNENDIVKYTTAKSVSNTNPFFIVDIKRKKHCKKSSSRQIIKYYNKSTHRNKLPVKMDKNGKNVETLSLLSLSFQNNNNNNDNNNSTDYIKQKNGLLQKLDTLNKKLKKTFKQLQATTSKSFINFNFNNTQIKEFSTILSYPLSNTKSEQDNNNVNTTPLSKKSQKNSKLKNSSIPKPSYHCLKYFQKNNNKKILSSSDSVVVNQPNSGNADDIKVLKNENENKNKNENEMKSKNTIKGLVLQENKIEKKPSYKYRMVYPAFYSVLLHIPVIKNKGMPLIQSTSHIQLEKRKLLEKVVSIKGKENDNSKNINNNNSNNNNNDNNNNKLDNNNKILLPYEKEMNNKVTNCTETEKSLEYENRSIQDFEKSLFEFPEGLALVLFILYATFMF